VSASPDDSPSGLTSFRRYTWWSLIGATECALIVFVGEWILDPDVPVVARTAGAVGLLVTVVASGVLLSRRMSWTAASDDEAASRRPPIGWLVAGCVGTAVLGVAALAVHNYGLWSLAPAIMVTVVAMYLPRRSRRILIVGAVVAAAVVGGVVALAAGDDLPFATVFPAVMVASIAWVMLGLLWSWDVAERLDRARRLSAELAVKDERLRFAADLHDIQGHHLQVIALKSELAERLVAADPARATAELQDVRQLAAAALRDTRAVVQGYRRASIDDEIANAAKVLAAADIDARLTVEPGSDTRTSQLAESSRHLLAMVVREATTNVLRHSQAQHAELAYRVDDGVVRLRVRNDGADEPEGADQADDAAAGTGLRGLAERLRSAGGELTWEQVGDRFELTATLPVTERAQSGEAR
jgi:two-component system, NarL family, sensor histidine kinase DesK